MVYVYHYSSLSNKYFSSDNSEDALGSTFGSRIPKLKQFSLHLTGVMTLT